MHDDMRYGRNQGQGQGHSREVDRQSPTGLIFNIMPRLGGGIKRCFCLMSVSMLQQYWRYVSCGVLRNRVQEGGPLV